MRQYYIYLLASESRRFYAGVTNDLHATVVERKIACATDTSPRDHIHKLVWCEPMRTSQGAEARARQLRHWPRPARVRFIQLNNPEWRDLAAGWEIATDSP